MKYKMIRVFNEKRNEENDNIIESADYEIMAQFPDFEVSEEYEAKLVELCKEKNIPYGSYTIVEYQNHKPWCAAGQFFYHSPEEIADGATTFLDYAEWNDRVPVEVALGVDFSRNTFDKDIWLDMLDGKLKEVDSMIGYLLDMEPEDKKGTYREALEKVFEKTSWLSFINRKEM